MHKYTLSHTHTEIEIELWGSERERERMREESTSLMAVLLQENGITVILRKAAWPENPEPPTPNTHPQF